MTRIVSGVMGLDLGNKRTILKELRDRAVAGDDEPVPVIQRSWYQEALTEPDPLRCLQLHARNIVRMHTRYAELAEVLRVGAAVEPELRELWQLGHDQRRIGAAIMVDALLSKTALNPAWTETPPSTNCGCSPGQISTAV